MQFDKRSQLSKNKRLNPKRMPAKEYLPYVDFVKDIADEKCQVCGAPGQDIHHSYFGAGGRDDRYITLACRECHSTIHHSKDTSMAEMLRLQFKTIGKENWRRYVNQF